MFNRKAFLSTTKVYQPDVLKQWTQLGNLCSSCKNHSNSIEFNFFNQASTKNATLHAN